MKKVLLMSGIAVFAVSFAPYAYADNVETKLIFNSDTGVEADIAQNPKVIAKSETAVTEPVVEPSKVGVTEVEIETKAETIPVAPPKPVLKSELAESVPDMEDAIEENAGAIAQGAADVQVDLEESVTTDTPEIAE